MSHEWRHIWVSTARLYTHIRCITYIVREYEWAFKSHERCHAWVCHATPHTHIRRMTHKVREYECVTTDATYEFTMHTTHTSDVRPTWFVIWTSHERCHMRVYYAILHTHIRHVTHIAHEYELMSHDWCLKWVYHAVLVRDSFMFTNYMSHTSDVLVLHNATTSTHMSIPCNTAHT